MQGRGITVVKLLEVAYLPITGNIDKLRKTPGLVLHLALQPLQETLHIDTPAGQRQHLSTAGQVYRNRVHDRPTDATVYLLALLPQVEKAQISAHAETGQKNILIVLHQGVGNNSVQVFRRATVIKPGLAVHHATAGTEVPGQHIPALGYQSPSHAEHVGPATVAFQAV